MHKKIFFSRQVEKKHIIYKILGIKISFKNPNFVDEFKIETEKAIKIQDAYDLTKLRSTRKMILFLTPSTVKICGGVISIYSLCEISRELNPDSTTIICTYPNNKYTYAINDQFLNNEKIYRFSQIIDNCQNLNDLLIHIPDYYSNHFYKDLTLKDIRFLKSIKNLHLNIMNQNIKLMPDPNKIKNLYKLTNNITQTIAHDRYANQEVCNKWQIPTHLFSAMWNMTNYKKREFVEKEKIIVLSPDNHNNKKEIINKLQKEFKDWKFITVKKLNFSEYMDLISRALFTITFGEGFDGYFLQPAIVNSIGIAVYNDDFFPDKSWLKLDNVFESYNDMSNNIIKFITEYSKNQQKYSELSALNKKLQDKIYNYKQYKDNLKRFYEKKYDFLPQMENL